ncbi:hypothetical protein GQ457_05G017630 [Hibiscus cannabinus]
MDKDLANLSIDDSEDEAIPIPPEVGLVADEYDLCLVGRFLTSSVVHFPSVGRCLGISITDIGEKRFCFRFYHVGCWMALHGLMARQIGNFVGAFLEYDTSLITSRRKRFMWIKIVPVLATLCFGRWPFDPKLHP